VGIGIAPVYAEGTSDYSAQAGSSIVYIVQRGDTLSGIARRFGTTVKAIMSTNGLTSTRIYVGQRLVIPVPQPGPVHDMVDGWVGRIVKFPHGSQFDDYFQRGDGQRSGIEAIDGALRQRIETYRWTGAQVQVWGRLLNSVPDMNGCQILVERIEAVSGPEEDSRNLALFSSASASSIFPSDRWGTYHAWSAIDSRIESPWVEGAAGPGVGEWILLTFPGTVEVWGIGLDVGYDRDADIFYANNRIKRATFIFSNGERVTLDFADTRGVQMVHLARAPGPNVETTYVKMVIEEVYPGSRYDDTCLGEIEVWGRTR
jgi:LysM repeat protein